MTLRVEMGPSTHLSSTPTTHSTKTPFGEELVKFWNVSSFKTPLLTSARRSGSATPTNERAASLPPSCFEAACVQPLDPVAFHGWRYSHHTMVVFPLPPCCSTHEFQRVAGTPRQRHHLMQRILDDFSALSPSPLSPSSPLAQGFPSPYTSRDLHPLLYQPRSGRSHNGELVSSSGSFLSVSDISRQAKTVYALPPSPPHSSDNYEEHSVTSHWLSPCHPPDATRRSPTWERGVAHLLRNLSSLSVR